jgi:hypothetical protein
VRERRQQQLSFETPPHPLEAELRALEPDRLTPLQALELLAQWKRRWDPPAV